MIARVGKAWPTDRNPGDELTRRARLWPAAVLRSMSIRSRNASSSSWLTAAITSRAGERDPAAGIGAELALDLRREAGSRTIRWIAAASKSCRRPSRCHAAPGAGSCRMSTRCSATGGRGVVMARGLELGERERAVERCRRGVMTGDQRLNFPL